MATDRFAQTLGNHGAIARDPLTQMQIRIGVMGSAGGDLDPSVTAVCRRLGRTIAGHGCCLLTGACPGLPHEVVLGAKDAAGHVVGISPASSLKEHVNTYGSPYREYDVLVFTGLGLMGRELVNIHSSDIVIVVSGRSGTLGEFAIAYEEGKLIGVLAGSGGITAALPVLEANLNKQTGAEVTYESDPDVLVDRLLERYVSGSYKCPCSPVHPDRALTREAVARPVGSDDATR
jgi:uncharacterized protein (TIGR00725 family)